MNHRKLIALGAAIAALGIPASASASSGETANTHVMLSQTAINSQTCRFAFPERDPATGPTWFDLRGYVLYEDARSDAKMACLAHHMGQRGPRGARGWTGPAGPAGPAGTPGAPGGVAGYTQVSASGTGQTVTATCPTGDVVLGGGSLGEFTGSYPSSASSWTIGRDHLSPKTMTVIATCAKAVS